MLSKQAFPLRAIRLLAQRVVAADGGDPSDELAIATVIRETAATLGVSESFLTATPLPPAPAPAGEPLPSADAPDSGEPAPPTRSRKRKP